MRLDNSKPHSIHLRLSDEHYKFLASMAETMGVGVADVTRILINGYMVASQRVESRKAELGDLDANNTNNQ